MRSRWIPGIGLVTVLLIVAAGVVALSDQVHPLSDSLEQADVVEEDHDDRTQTLIPFGDEDEVHLTADARVREIEDDLHQVRWVFSHGEDTRLESVELGFEFGDRNPQVSFQEPGGSPWEPVTFQRVSDSMGERTVFEVPDLGSQGNGTVVLEFLLGPHDDEIQEPQDFRVDFDATLSRDSTLQLTDYRAGAWIELQMPGKS